MAGIYSQGGSAGHRYAGWLEKVEAKNFQFGGKVFNGSPSAIYVGSNLVWKNWLKHATWEAILGAFGQDGMAVINATNAYLNQLAASGQAGKDKATALAALINEDPMMVCSLGLQPELTVLPSMPIRFFASDESSYINTGILMKGSGLQIELTAVINKIQSDQAFYYGARNVNNGGNPLYFGQMSSYHCIDAGSRRTIQAAHVGEIVKWQIGGGTYKLFVNGSQVNSNTYSTNFNIEVPVYLYGLDTKNYGKNSSTEDGIAETKIKNNGIDYWFVPFISKTQGKGVIDLEGETFYPNAGSGDFIEQYKVYQNGQWVTWTPSTP